MPARVKRSARPAKPAPARSINDVVPELARRFLVAPEPPTRLPTVRQLAREHRSSLASIHAAIGRLEGAGAIEVDRRGRLGAFLVKRISLFARDLREKAERVRRPSAFEPRLSRTS